MTEPGPSGLGPLGDLQMMAAMLRRDRDDVASYVRVLSGTLGSSLPPGMIDINYDRSLADRLARRTGIPIRLVVHGAQGDLELATVRGRTSGLLRRTVNGVVIARREVGVDEWVTLLAQELTEVAARDSRAQVALEALLKPGH